MTPIAGARIIPLAAPASDNLEEWALFYGRLGLHVLPVVARDKRPACAHGVHEATTDPERVAAWWRETPAANVGLACGHSGLVVFDVDHRHGGADTWGRIAHEHGIPDAPACITSGGFHLYMRDPTGRVRARKLGAGVDVLAAGRYALAPPSIHPSGARYRWASGRGIVETRGLPAIPRSLLAELGVEAQDTAAPKLLRRRPSLSRATAYGAAALTGLLDDIANATPGERHNVVFRVACRAAELVLRGDLPGAVAFDSILDAAIATCRGEGRDAELQRTIRDAFARVGRGGPA